MFRFSRSKKLFGTGSFSFLAGLAFSLIQKTYANGKHSHFVENEIDVLRWDTIPENDNGNIYGKLLFMYLIIYSTVNILRITCELILYRSNILSILHKKLEMQKTRILTDRTIKQRQTRTRDFDPEAKSFEQQNPSNMNTQDPLVVNSQTDIDHPKEHKLSIWDKLKTVHYPIRLVMLCHDLKLLTSIMVFSIGIVGIFNFKVKLWVSLLVMVPWVYTLDEKDSRVMYMNYNWKYDYYIYIFGAMAAIYVTQYIPQFIQTIYPEYTQWSLMLAIFEIFVAIVLVIILQKIYLIAKKSLHSYHKKSQSPRSQKAASAFKFTLCSIAVLLIVFFPIFFTYTVQSQVDGYATSAFPSLHGQDQIEDAVSQQLSDDPAYLQQYQGWSTIIELDQSNGTRLNGLMHGFLLDVIKEDYEKQNPINITTEKFTDGTGLNYYHTTIPYNQTFNIQEISSTSNAVSAISLQQKFYSQLFTFDNLVTSNRDWIKRCLNLTQTYNLPSTTFYITVQVDFPDMNCHYTVGQIQQVHYMPIQVNHYIYYNSTDNAKELWSHEHVGYVDTTQYAEDVQWWQCNNHQHVYKFLRLQTIVNADNVYIGNIDLIQPESDHSESNYPVRNLPTQGLEGQIYGQLMNYTLEDQFSEVEYDSIICKGQGVYPEQMILSNVAVRQGKFICQYSNQFYTDGDYIQSNAYILTQRQLFVVFALMIVGFVYNVAVCYVLVILEYQQERMDIQYGQSSDAFKGMKF